MPDSSPYCRIGVASTFSPRFEQVLAEAKRMRDRFGAELRLIYVGESSPEVTEKFRTALAALSLPIDSVVHFERGDPAEAIVRATEKNGIQLVVAGALEKQVVLHPFLGNVARRLLRESRCSVMLFTDPARTPKPLKNIVFVAEDPLQGAEALRSTLQLAEGEKSERLYVIRMMTTFDELRRPRPGDAATTGEAELEQFVLRAGQTTVPIEVRYIRGNTGFAVADFVHAIGADLLVVPIAPRTEGGRLPPNLEWLSDVIPCNLWVIR